MKTKIIGFLISTLIITTTIATSGNTTNILLSQTSPIPPPHNIHIMKTDHGEILDQSLDELGRGYTVLRLWGSYYEMGYAYADLLGPYIIQAYHDTKNYIGDEDVYEELRDLMEVSIWKPPEIEEEINGMVDSLANSYPQEHIDDLDVKVWNCFGDWAYGMGCRAHTCWGRYVSNPIKTLSTVRLDFMMYLPVFAHHVLCARIPENGALQYITLDFPGCVIVVSAVNEFGTVMRQQDFASWSPDLLPGRMSRMTATRYATTLATNPNVSTHVATVFSELQQYEIMTGTFLNYYAPEGYGGVMSCKPWYSGPDFYDLRLPQEVWHHGEAMITTNQWTDGTYTPPDEDFGADAYYNDETAKTHESHWNLLADNPQPPPIVILHMFSVAYRGRRDMTIWADGLINATTNERTPRLEYEWEDLTGMVSPNINIDSITGGIGFSAVITNEGKGPATNLEWIIAFDGGIIIPKETTGTIPVLATGDQETIKTFIFGFAKPTISVFITCDEGISTSKKASGLLILFFILGVS